MHLCFACSPCCFMHLQDKWKNIFNCLLFFFPTYLFKGGISLTSESVSCWNEYCFQTKQGVLLSASHPACMWAGTIRKSQRKSTISVLTVHNLSTSKQRSCKTTQRAAFLLNRLLCRQKRGAMKSMCTWAFPVANGFLRSYTPFKAMTSIRKGLLLSAACWAVLGASSRQSWTRPLPCYVLQKHFCNTKSWARCIKISDCEASSFLWNRSNWRCKFSLKQCTSKNPSEKISKDQCFCCLPITTPSDTLQPPVFTSVEIRAVDVLQASCF